jgi:DNA polymerase-3 subunit gamma/tau
MAYEVLYRKWRPRGFDAFVGQEHVRKALAHALDHDRLHHAYLFTGTRGVGKTTVARIFARCLNCERGISSSPCGTCGACTQILAGRFVDLIEVDAASRTRIDDTRDLLDNVQYAPTVGRYKVYLIDEVHMLSTASFNALLKTLEEPPPRVVFLLATTDPRKLPVTVLSRCQQFNLRNYPAEHIAAHLRNVLAGEQVPVEEAAIALLARAARGSMRDALSLTDQAIAHGAGGLRAAEVAELLGTVDHQALSRVLDALAAADAPALLAVCRDLAAYDVDHEDVLVRLAEALHDIAVAQVVPGAVPRSELDAALIARLAAAVSPEQVQLWYQIAIVGGRDLLLAPDGQVGLEMTLLRMLAFEPDGAPGAAGAPDAGGRPSRPPPGDAPPGRPARATEERVAAPAGAGTAGGPAASQARGSRAALHGLAAAPPPAAARVVVPAATRVGPAAAPRPTSVLAVAGSEPLAVAAGEQVAANGAMDAGSAADAWSDLVARLPLDGMARALCMHATACADGDDWLLTLRADGASLVSEPRRAAIAGALASVLGRPVSVRIEVGEPAAETPSQRRERVAREARARALATFRADRRVQALVDRFGGTLDEDSVRPLS